MQDDSENENLKEEKLEEEKPKGAEGEAPEEIPKKEEKVEANTAPKRPGAKRGQVPLGEIRLRLPQQGEIFARIKAVSGGSRMVLDCEDGKERMGRIIGKMKKRFWMREGDIVIVKPWAFATVDNKAEIIWRYNPTQKSKLESMGRLDWLKKSQEKEFEL